MSLIQLNLSKLLGFKIVSKNIGSKTIAIGAKLGSKPGFKPSHGVDLTGAHVRIGTKIDRKSVK